MRIWRSVVGKLWMTILLLVSFVLIILTMLLLEFFQSYNVGQIEQNLKGTATKIARIVEVHPNDGMGKEIAIQLADKNAQVIIAYNVSKIVYPTTDSKTLPLSPETLVKDADLSKVFSSNKVFEKEMTPPGNHEQNRYNHIIVAAAPLHINKENGAVFIYQSLDVLKETTDKTTKLILLAAGIAIILTTFFAFFLSTRITAPLRKMREAAFQVAKGKFDTKVPVASHDEIGELATAFNQMGKQLKFNINALNQEKEQLRSILSSMADGVLTFNRDGTILITNPPAELFLQHWFYEQGKDSQLPAPKEMLDLLDQVIKTDKEQTSELTIQGRTYVVIISPLYNRDNVRGAVVVIRDMTEERRLDTLRDDFIANVSHELRTPIAMLQGYSEAIIDDIAVTDEEKKEFAKIIYDETLRIGRLVNELLDLARMEAGHISLNLDMTPIQSFIQRVTYKFQGVARESNVLLSSEVEQEAAMIEMDPDRIEQVLTNLIDNAIRYTPENGTVKVTQEEFEDGVLISVTDSGTGIQDEDLPFVFERFYKADKARTRGKSGTGLGLAIAKNIIEAHHGRISVKSKVGQGTTFSFYLPRIQSTK